MSNKMDRPLVTVDGRTLMDRPLEPPNFVVDTLISQGLHILAGSPKVGKSWLALWLAVTVAKGEPVWGMSVKQGTTLYLCLEDSVLRIQNRLFEITEDAPDSVHFCTECAPIGQGLEEQVEGFLVAHPDTVLVLVDTLQMVRPVHDATYANDYQDLSVLKRLADKHGIAILLIHHLRKETADDVFNRTKLLKSTLFVKLPAIRFHILTSFLVGKLVVLPPFSRGNTAFFKNAEDFLKFLQKFFERTKCARPKSPDGRIGIVSSIQMIRQFIYISVVSPGGGRAFFDKSITVGFCRYAFCFMAATSFSRRFQQ